MREQSKGSCLECQLAQMTIEMAEGAATSKEKEAKFKAKAN